MLSTDESPGRLGPATSADVLPNNLRQDGVRFCREPGQPGCRLCRIAAAAEARIIEAKREGWLGEVEGLHVSYSGAKNKLAQIDSTLRRKTAATDLGMPPFASISGRSLPHEN